MAYELFVSHFYLPSIIPQHYPQQIDLKSGFPCRSFLLSDTMKNVWQEYDKGVQKGEKELKKGI